jgi:hypothetical protein
MIGSGGFGHTAGVMRALGKNRQSTLAFSGALALSLGLGCSDQREPRVIARPASVQAPNLAGAAGARATVQSPSTEEFPVVRAPDSSAGVVTPPSLPSGVWRDVVVGGGGFVSGLLYQPAPGGLLLARTDIGGAYRWDTTNSAWHALQDGLTRAEADSMGVLSLAIDPTNPARLYLLTGKYTQSWAGMGTLLVSNDLGSTFSKIQLPFKIGGNEDGRGTGERLVVDPTRPERLLLGSTQDGLWQSTDGGVNWLAVDGLDVRNISFVLFGQGEARGQIIVAGADDGPSLWRSLDNGENWGPLEGQPAGLLALHGVQTGTDFIFTFANAVGPNGATAGGVARFASDTGAWTDITPPGAMSGFSGVSIDTNDPNHLVVSTLDRWYPRDEVYQTLNGGETWTALLENATFSRTQAPYVQDSTPHWLTDVELEPGVGDHALFVTGYGVWSCRGLLGAAPVQCDFQSRGLEETVAMQLVSPSDGAPLLSALGDIDGFRHDDLDVSPPAGRFKPLFGTTLSIANAEFLPARVVKAHNEAPFGSLSDDGGTTWTGFATAPAGTTGGGTRAIALGADGSRIVWAPTGAPLSYSADSGATWAPATLTGGPAPTARLHPVADRVVGGAFYFFDPLTGRIWRSVDGGQTFSVAADALPTLQDWQQDDAELATAPGRVGELWLAAGAPGGLWHSADGGANFERAGGVGESYRLGFGLAASGQTYPSLLLWGTPTGQPLGLYISSDVGQSFSRLNDDQHNFGWIHAVAGDPRRFGRVYVGTEGRGIRYYDWAPPGTP